jgi:cyclic beta-1,2-glucan synthetase
MEYDFLFDSRRHLLTIGYNVTEHRADASHYDLLASEARLCSASSRLPRGNCRRKAGSVLGRLLTSTSGEPVLLSWSGSMFEYLMPLLVMPTYDDTLLDQTCKAAVARQIEYGEPARRPLGYLRVRLQHGRRAAQLPVSRLRCARTGTQAWAGR